MLLRIPPRTDPYLSVAFTLSCKLGGDDWEIRYPMKIRTRPPMVPISKVAVADPINHPSPRISNNKIATSAIMCPITTIGPARGPFLSELEMVTVNMGPGTKAPDRPTRNELTVNKITCTINSTTLENLINKELHLIKIGNGGY